ncbi:glycoside hydrolase family 73 protein [Blattabacterium cuenoti]|uniref:glycoside hydrolase family 73 protein n=1 Tax=Blattabacterium cuenoti TaxID=1653831 RepID=UPI00163CD4D1|nr:glucosaminidase domain-containing protein [Blattabacterium cuenoti]
MKEFFCFILSFSITFFFLFSKEKEEEKKNEKQNVLKYIKEYAKFSIEEMEKFGIPASIKLGQGILESSSGNSPLAKLTNNHFGIKCGKDWKGDIYYHDDDLPKECFRKYKSVRESFNDHSKFLKKPRYSELFLLKKKDYRSWAIGLKKAGYATSLKYSNQLISQIEKYSLWIFDEETSQGIEKRIDKYLTEIKMKKTKKTIFESFFQSHFFKKISFFLKKYVKLEKK